MGMLVLMLLMTTVSAELLISPSPQIGVKLNEEKTFSLNLTNTFEFRIQSIQFSPIDGFTFPTNITIEPNQTKTIDFKVKRTTIESKTLSSNVSFKYIKDIPEHAMTHYINYTTNGFNPDRLEIFEHDTVTWKNQDTESLEFSGSFFQHTLDPNQTVSEIFNTVGTENYQDDWLIWAGTIIVLSRSSPQEINNPKWNKNIQFNLDVIADPTNISIIEVSKTDFNIEVGGASGTFYFIIKNTGIEIAQKIHLSSTESWITFAKNDFNIDSGEKQSVDFKVVPFVLTSNETNKNHTIVITAKGLNTESITTTINVFIPYKEFDESDPEYLLKLIEDFCKRNPNNAFCNPPNATSGSVVVRDPEIPINLTASQVYAMLKRFQRIEDSNQRTDNKLNSLVAQIEREFPEFAKMLNISVNQATDSEDRRSTNEAIFWIAIIFVILISGFLITWKMYEKWKHKQYLMGVGAR